MKLNSLFSELKKKKKAKLLGRGIGCGKGKTSGRGHKGQKARTGVSINAFEGGQQPIFRRLPKRGFKSLNNDSYCIVNLYRLQNLIDSGKVLEDTVVSKEMLCEFNLISSATSRVKILGKGDLKFKISVEYDYISKSAEGKVYNISADTDVNK